MSSRNLRKLTGGNVIPNPSDSDDDDERYGKFTSGFSGLALSPDSSCIFQDCKEDDQEEISEPNQPTSMGAISKKVSKKNQDKRKYLADLVLNPDSPSTYKDCIVEDQEGLSEPHQPISTRDIPKKETKKNRDKQKHLADHGASSSRNNVVEDSRNAEYMQKLEETLFTVDRKNLNPEDELDRLYGTLDGKRGYIKRRICIKAVIVSMDNPSVLKMSGLTMVVDRTEDSVTYFKYIHSGSYKEQHLKFLRDIREPENHVAIAEYIFGNRHNMKVHVEAYLMVIDYFFKAEETDAAYNMLEQTIQCMQRVWHPTMSILNRKVRLEYAVVENRPFHLALLKYLYLLSNKGCHLTALQSVKLLLNLDPSDPVAVIYIMDVIALRARQYDWLIKAIELLDEQRKVMYMFNIQYSYALAHYHLAVKSKEDTSKADDLLMNAITYFPTLVNLIYQSTNTTPPELVSQHNFFKKHSHIKSETMGTAIRLYSKLTKAMWREPLVMKWFTKNVLKFISMYDEDSGFKAKVDYCITERMVLFREAPREIYRHLAAISPLSKLLLGEDDIKVPCRHSWDPFPPDAIDNENNNVNAPPTPRYRALMLLRMFLQSLSIQHSEHSRQNEEYYAKLKAEGATST